MDVSQFEQLKKKTNFLSVQNSFFFLSYPVEKEIISNLCKNVYLDSEFEIGRMNSLIKSES